MEVPPEFTVAGLHCKEARANGGSRVTEAVCEPLPNAAVTTAVCMLVIVPAVAVKLALVAPLATVAEAGTVRLEVLSLRVTVVLPGAA